MNGEGAEVESMEIFHPTLRRRTWGPLELFAKDEFTWGRSGVERGSFLSGERSGKPPRSSVEREWGCSSFL